MSGRGKRARVVERAAPEGTHTAGEVVADSWKHWPARGPGCARTDRVATRRGTRHRKQSARHLPVMRCRSSCDPRFVRKAPRWSKEDSHPVT